MQGNVTCDLPHFSNEYKCVVGFLVCMKLENGYYMNLYVLMPHGGSIRQKTLIFFQIEQNVQRVVNTHKFGLMFLVT